ncbi:hypothetical protein ARSEF4850_005150 [Beauveria asiatica]
MDLAGDAVALFPAVDIVAHLLDDAGMVAADAASNVGAAPGDVLPVGRVDGDGLDADEQPARKDLGQQHVADSGPAQLDDDNGFGGCRRHLVECIQSVEGGEFVSKISYR